MYAAKGAQPASKIHTITNGFDQEDFSGHHEVRPAAQFTITYAGTLAARYPVEDFIKALNLLDFSRSSKGYWFMGRIE